MDSFFKVRHSRSRDLRILSRALLWLILTAFRVVRLRRGVRKIVSRVNDLNKVWMTRSSGVFCVRFRRVLV